MTKHTCRVCKTVFQSIHTNTKFCSRDCSLEDQRARTGRHKTLTISPGTVGAISELRAATYFLERGYAVFRALSPSCFCDLIAIKDSEVKKVEVRTGYVSVAGKLTYSKLLNGNPSCFAVYTPATGDVHIVELENGKNILEAQALS